MSDGRLWQRLREEGAEAFCRRTGATLEADTGRVRLAVLNGTLVLDPAAECMEWHVGTGEAPATFPDLTVEATAVNYLLSAVELPLANRWISPLDVPSWQPFFRGPHALPNAELEAAFGEAPEAFREAAEALGGTPLTFADLSYEFAALPRVKLAVLLWRGDEEFPARVRFLVDETITQHLAVDAALGVAHLVTDRLIATV